MTAYGWGEYLEMDSPLHRIRPEVKLSATALFSVAVLSVDSLPLLLLLTLLLSSAVLWGGIGLPPLARGLKPVLPFLAVVFLLPLLFFPGAPLFPTLSSRVFTQEGLERGILVAWRFALLLSASSLLTLTTSPREMIGALKRFFRALRPLGVSPRDLATMITLSLRFVFLFREEAGRVERAAKARGMRRPPYRRPLLWLRNARALSYPLIVGLLRRGDEVSKAMMARGYRRGLP
jgi:energy-coupling factor transport system permease protein